MTMSDDVVIKDYADLINDSKLRGDDPDAVGLELQDLGGDTDHLVAWLPGWLVEEKDVELVGRSDNVVSGQVDVRLLKQTQPHGSTVPRLPRGRRSLRGRRREPPGSRRCRSPV